MGTPVYSSRSEQTTSHGLCPSYAIRSRGQTILLCPVWGREAGSPVAVGWLTDPVPSKPDDRQVHSLTDDEETAAFPRPYLSYCLRFGVIQGNGWRTLVQPHGAFSVALVALRCGVTSEGD